MRKVIVATMLASFMAFFVIGVWHFLPTEESAPEIIQYTSLEELKGKVEELERRFRAGEQTWQMAYKLGVGYLHLGRPEDAIPVLETGITLNPDFYRMYETLGMAYYRLGRLQSAIDVWQKALKVSPQAEHLKDMINRVKLKLEAGERIKEMEKLPEEKKNWLKRFELATLYIVVKEYDRAREELEKAIEEKPNIVDLYTTLANVYALKGDFTKAVENQERAYKLRPEDEAIKRRLEEMKRLKKALESGRYHTGSATSPKANEDNSRQ